MNLKDLQYKYGLNRATIAAIVWVHSLWLYLFDALLFMIPGKIEQTGTQKLLVIKLDAIGDFILWLDFARGLRQLYPKYEVTLLANQTWASFAAGIPLFDTVLPVKRMRFILDPVYRFRTLFNLRQNGYDLLIDPAFSREFQFSPAVARTCAAKLRLAPQGSGSNQRAWQKKISDAWYDRLLPCSSEPLMELCRNAEFLRALGLTDFKARLPDFLPKSAPEKLVGTPYYVIFPGAGWVNRQWPLENFAALTTLLNRQTGWRGVICGGPGEEPLAQKIREMSAAPLEDHVGKTTLDELAATIASAQLLVSNETSAIHLAAAVSTRAVCILGGGHFGRFLPYKPEQELTGKPVPVAVWHPMDCFDCNWECIYPISGDQPVPCIAKISIQDVWEKLRLLCGFKEDKGASLN